MGIERAIYRSIEAYLIKNRRFGIARSELKLLGQKHAAPHIGYTFG